MQAFLDFRNFPFNMVYTSILFSSPLVLPHNLVTSIYAVFAAMVFALDPHISSVNHGMSVHQNFLLLHAATNNPMYRTRRVLHASL